MMRNYLKVTWRNMLRQKAYTFINIAGLTVGMACCMLIMMWVQDEVSYDRFHAHLDDLYRMTSVHETETWISSPWALRNVLIKDFPEIEKGTWYLKRISQSLIGEQRYNDTWAFIGPDFLDMFTFPFLKGDPARLLADGKGVALSRRIAKKYFGDEDPMGKTIMLDNRVALVVRGVFENVPHQSHFQFDLLAHAVALVGEARMETWSSDCETFFKLHPGTNVMALDDKINAAMLERSKGKYTYRLQPLKQIHLYALDGMDPVVYVYLFASIAVVILLIACVNFMNLSMAKYVVRTKEVGMRKVVGANKRDILRQFLGESIVFAVVAFLLAGVLVWLALPWFNVITAKQLTINLARNPLLPLGMLGTAILAGLASGLYPALRLSSVQPASLVRGASLARVRGNALRKGLILFQFTAAITLITSSMVISKQMRFIWNSGPGFDKEQIVSIRTTREVRRNMVSIMEVLRGNMGISRVTSASSLPLNINSHNPVYWEGRGPENYEAMNFVCCDFDYFDTFGMEIVMGRGFSRAFSTDSSNYIINEAALKLTGYQDPIGRMFSMWTKEGRIIGVVKDFHGNSLHNDIQPLVFMLYQNIPPVYLFVKVRPGNIPETIGFIEKTLKKMAPSFIFEYRFLNDVFHEQYLDEQRLGKIVTVFTALAIFISCLGLLGLALFMAERRKKEVAVRKVLGARIGRLLAVLSKEFVVLIAIANVVSCPASYFLMSRWIQRYAYHAQIGWEPFVFAGMVVLGIATLSVGYQTLSAALRNPVDSLRCE